jgi:hypothetical protein
MSNSIPPKEQPLWRSTGILVALLGMAILAGVAWRAAH